MSVPNNSLTFKEWFAFAEHLATNLTTIGHNPVAGVVRYARVSFPEMVSSAFEDMSGPALLAEAAVSEGVDNSSNNLLATRYLAWTIVHRTGTESTLASVLDLELACESIAVSVLARLRAERIHKGGKVFADVQMDRWEGEAITPFLKAGWCGYRIMVPVMVSDHRLKYDPALWTDAVGAWTFSDISGLSCAALNHSTLGLTLQQRLSCILPRYDFSSTQTQQALSAQQVADLEEWLGGGSAGTATFQLNGTTVGTITGTGLMNIPVRRVGVAIGSLVDGVWEVPPCDDGSNDPLTLYLNAQEADIIGIIPNPSGAEINLEVLNSQAEPVGFPNGIGGIDVGDVLIYPSEGAPETLIAQVKAEGRFNLPRTMLRYELEDGGNTFTDAYDTIWSDPNLLVDLTIAARNLTDTDGNVVGARKVTLADLINNSVPGCPTLAAQIAAGDADDIATFIRSSGKAPGVLAELIPAVDEADVVAQVYDVMTAGQEVKIDELYYFDIQVWLDGVDQPLITGVDPSVPNTLNITIS